MRPLTLLAIAGGAAAADAGNATRPLEWRSLFTPPFFADNPVPLMTGISCTASRTCFTSGGPPTNTMSVYRTDDAFATNVRLDFEDPPIMLLSIGMASGTEGAVAGLGLLGLVGGCYHTRDGRSFAKSRVGGWLPSLVVESQDIHSLGGGRYAFVGSNGNGQGAFISSDAGASYTAHAWPDGLTDLPARYGSFPTENTWYLTGGTWPSDEPPARGAKWLSRDVFIDRSHGGGGLRHVARNASVSATGAGYAGVITKTDDGGRTWSVQHHGAGYYFNGVSCTSATHCVAVAEGAGSAYIFGTDDGETWTERLHWTENGAGFLAVKMVNAQEGWAGGGYNPGLGIPHGVFFHTADGGRTWSRGGDINGVGTAMQISMLSPDHGFAVGIGLATATVLEYGRAA